MPTDEIRLACPENLPSDFVDLVDKCVLIDKPQEADLLDLRNYFREKPHLYSYLFDMVEHVRSKMTDNLFEQEAPKMAAKANMEFIKENLGYDDAPMIEKLMIDNIVNCWFRQYWVEYQLAGFMGGDVSISVVEWWEKRLSATQRRYLRACETLARIRKITRSTLQVNIAEMGSQQLNVAGDLVTTSNRQ